MTQLTEQRLTVAANYGDLQASQESHWAAAAAATAPGEGDSLSSRAAPVYCLKCQLSVRTDKMREERGKYGLHTGKM